MKPYLKLFSLLLATAWLIRVQNLEIFLIVGVSSLIYLNKKQKPWLDRLKFLAPVFIVMLLIQGLIGSWQIAVTSWLKLVDLSLIVLIYSSSTSVKELVKIFSFLGPNARLLLTLTFNLVPIIIKEWQNITLVQKSRGYRSINPFPIIVPLLHRTFRRAEQLTLVLSLSATGEI